MDNRQIHDSFEKIVPKAEKKTYIYYDILRNYDKKGYVTTRRLHFWKQKLDRYVPAIALGMIVLCVFSFYGVKSGLFTGVPFRTTNQILEDTGYTAEAGGVADDAAAQDENAAVADAAPTEGTQAVEERAEKAAAPEAQYEGEDTVTANIYGAVDIGYTHYIVEGMPQDPLVLWDEMQELGAVPAEITLEAYSLSDSELTLEFDESLQEIQDKSATDAIITGIAVTYKEVFPGVGLTILSGSEPVLFEGTPIDVNAKTVEDLNITDTEQHSYGAAEEEGT